MEFYRLEEKYDPFVGATVTKETNNQTIPYIRLSKDVKIDIGDTKKESHSISVHIPKMPKGVTHMRLLNTVYEIVGISSGGTNKVIVKGVRHD